MADDLYWSLAILWQSGVLGVATAWIIRTRGRVDLRPFAARLIAPPLVGYTVVPILRLIC